MTPLAVSNVEVFAIVGVFCLFIALGGHLFRRWYKSLLSKGYKSPFVAAGLFGCYVAALTLGTVAALMFTDQCWECTPSADAEYFRPDLIGPRVARLTAAFAVGTAVVAIPTGVVVAVVHRAPRRAGRRQSRFPWNGLARALVAFMTISALAGYMDWIPRRAAWSLFSTLLAGYFASKAFARRTQSMPLESAMAADRRPPVLYLRPFDREEEVFALPTTGECLDLGIPLHNPWAFRQHITLEQYLARKITDGIGPFVALGDPNDYLPPEGAARAYIEDADWQPAFRRLLDSSACVLMTIGGSANLNWELRCIRQAGLQTKLFVLTRPTLTAHWKWVTRWYTKRDREQWPGFATELARCGLELDAYPGTGSVARFDAAGRGSLVTAEVRTPADYVQALHDALRHAAEGRSRQTEPSGR